MDKKYLTRDPLASQHYRASIDPAHRIVFTPMTSADKILKSTLRSKPFETYDEFIKRLNFISVPA